jgi:hypothetical protein
MNVMATMLGAAVLLTATSAGADRGIAIRAWPAFSTEPANVLVQVDVERHADNRLLIMRADSGEFFSSSQRELKGEDGPRTSAFPCRELPAGNYEIEAVVFGRDGRRRSTAHKFITVLPR